jgi:hypothetical protein
MGCRPSRAAAGLCARTRRFRWRRRRLGRQRRLVPIGTARSLCADLSRQPGIHDAGQRQQHDRERHAGHDRLQHNHRQQNNDDHQHYLREPDRTGRGSRSSAKFICRRTARGEGGGESNTAADRRCAGERPRRGESHAGERIGSTCRNGGARNRSSSRGANQAGGREKNSAACSGSVRKETGSDGSPSGPAVTENTVSEFASGCSGATHGESCTPCSETSKTAVRPSESCGCSG